jgi:tetratricopeptide (TPR) repeat protein
VYALLAEPPQSSDLEQVLHAQAARVDVENAVYSRTLYLLVLCVLGRHDLAFERSERDSESLLLNAPWVHTVDHTFYRGLSAAVLAGTSSGKARRRYRLASKHCLRALERWARGGPDFAHMVTLLRAEHARLAGDRTKAQLLYEQAAQRARQQSFPHHAALAQERRASLLASARRQTEASAALREALALYREWGALGKVVLLTREERVSGLDG